MGKRINLVVFIDGTGNNDFKNPAAKRTNVARLWHACENMSSDEVEQQVYYKPGVGTRLWELVRGNAMGAYLKDRVYELLSTLNNEISIARQNNVEAHVYMFGFSRGAYAVRWLASLLDHDIDVLGVWDTVKATLVGPDVDVLPDKVKHAFHAIAIDEHRGLFNVTRFRSKNSSQASEVWFPGCHSDVGGGYEEAELSFAPLNWIARLSVRHGLLVDMSKIDPEPSFADHMPRFHDETSKKFWKFVCCLATGDWYFNRSICVTDVVYPTADALRAVGYAPPCLPQNCIAWRDEGFNPMLV